MFMHKFINTIILEVVNKKLFPCQNNQIQPSILQIIHIIINKNCINMLRVL